MTFEEAKTVLLDHGFELRRIKGSHYMFYRWIGGIKRKLVIPYHRPHILPSYVHRILELIEQIEDEQND